MAIQFNYGICTNRDKDGEGNPCPLCASKERQKLPAGRDFVCKECGEPLQKVKAPVSLFRKYKPLIIGALALVGAVLVIVLLWIPGGKDSLPVNDGQKPDSMGITEVDTADVMTRHVDAERIVFSEASEEISMKVGDEMALSVICTPDSTDETIAYRSEDLGVVTVSAEGVVKAVAKGITRIAAVTGRTGLSAILKVVVTDSRTEPVAHTDRLNLGFATYEGDMRNGKAHGNGVMTFKTRHVIPGAKDDIEAQAGEYVQGAWRNGEVNLVTLFQKDGNKVKIMHK